MTKYGRVIGKTRWAIKIRLEREEIPDASCGVAGRIAEGASGSRSACSAGCSGCGPATSRPPVIELPFQSLKGSEGDFSPGTRVRIEFNDSGTAISVLLGVLLPIAGGIAVFFALRELSRILAYFGALGAAALLGFLYTVLRRRSRLLSGAAVYPA